MTDEIDRSIRDEVMTLESNGSLWVLAEDYRALLARAEAAEAAGEQAKTLYRESLRRAEKAEIASANHAQFSHEWRGRAEAAEAELHKERARVLSLESEVAALRETHRADIAAGADLETKLAAAQEALAVLDAPTRPAPETVEEAMAWGGAGAIAAERQRQMDVEGWTPEHDDMHDRDELSAAAACYAYFGWVRPSTGAAPTEWPWSPEWWKPKDRRANLVRAGALIAAEIDRIDRAALRALAGELKDG